MQKVNEEDIQDIISRYKSGESIRSIEKNCRVKRTRIGNILKTNDIPRKSTGNSYKLRKYIFNESYFKVIDSEEKAYWLGFILADGHVSDDGVIIALSEKDKSHLSKFLNCVNSNSPIKERKSTNSVVVNIYSKEMVGDLRNLGIMKNKSYNATFPEISEELEIPLIRGIFDGDGSISITKNTYRKGINPNFAVSICGTPDIVFNVSEIINDHLWKSRIKSRNLTDTFQIYSWGGNVQSLRVLNLLYKNSTIHLDRKYQRYIHLKSLKHDNRWYRPQAR